MQSRGDVVSQLGVFTPLPYRGCKNITAPLLVHDTIHALHHLHIHRCTHPLILNFEKEHNSRGKGTDFLSGVYC